MSFDLNRPTWIAARLAVSLVVLAVCLSAAGARADESPAPAAASGLSSAPEFTVEGLDGKKYVLRDLLAKGPVLLDFWTTWCKPCLNELPELDKLYQKYQERGFTLLTIASDDAKTLSKVKPMVKSRGFTFPVGTDPERKIGNAYSVRNYPTSYLIGRDGKILSVAQGYRPGDEKKLEEEIVAALGPAPAGTDK